MEKKEETKQPSGSFSEVWDKRGQETDAANDFRKKIEMEITEARPGYAVGEYLRYRARRRPVFTGGYRGWHRSDDRARLRSPDCGWHDPLSESWKKHIQNHRPGAGNTEWLYIFGVRMQDL